MQKEHNTEQTIQFALLKKKQENNVCIFTHIHTHTHVHLFLEYLARPFLYSIFNLCKVYSFVPLPEKTSLILQSPKFIVIQYLY